MCAKSVSSLQNSEIFEYVTSAKIVNLHQNSEMSENEKKNPQKVKVIR